MISSLFDRRPGVPMKVVSEQLGHSSLAITADTYTSVLPAVAGAAAEASAGIVPRRSGATQATPTTPQLSDSPGALPFTVSSHSSRQEPKMVPKSQLATTKPQVSGGGPRGDRTHSPRIKSPLLCQLS